MSLTFEVSDFRILLTEGDYWLRYIPRKKYAEGFVPSRGFVMAPIRKEIPIRIPKNWIVV